MTPDLKFTEAESHDANRHFRANCGPHALAAAAGIHILKAIEIIPDFIKKGYTNPTMMEKALKTLDRHVIRTKGLHIQTLPQRGIARIQWQGKWLNSDVPPIVAYAYTHWVASQDDYVFCTAMAAFGWVHFDAWKFEIAALCSRNKYTGWHATHHYLLL